MHLIFLTIISRTFSYFKIYTLYQNLRQGVYIFCNNLTTTDFSQTQTTQFGGSHSDVHGDSSVVECYRMTKTFNCPAVHTVAGNMQHTPKIFPAGAAQ